MPSVAVEVCIYSVVALCVVLSVLVFLGGNHTSLFTCCRDGDFKGNPTRCSLEKKRTRRRSRKMGTDKFCLAYMTATENSSCGKVFVKYVSTHTDHEVTLHECKNLPLPKSVVEQVKRMFAIGVPIERIMDG